MMYFKMLILTVVSAIFFAREVTAIVTVNDPAVELIYTKDYTYLPVTSNFVHIKLKSEESARIVLTESPVSPSYDESTLLHHCQLVLSVKNQFPITPPIRQELSSGFLYEFSLHDYEKYKHYGIGITSQFIVNGRVRAEMETPEILSSEKFVEFLIYWYSDYLIMSRVGDPFPLFHWKASYPSNLNSIKYIGIHNGNLGSCGNSIGKNHWIIKFSPPANVSDSLAPFCDPWWNAPLRAGSTRQPPQNASEQPELTEASSNPFTTEQPLEGASADSELTEASSSPLPTEQQPEESSVDSELTEASSSPLLAEPPLEDASKEPELTEASSSPLPTEQPPEDTSADSEMTEASGSPLLTKQTLAEYLKELGLTNREIEDILFVKDFKSEVDHSLASSSLLPTEQPPEGSLADSELTEASGSPLLTEKSVEESLKELGLTNREIEDILHVKELKSEVDHSLPYGLKEPDFE